MRIPSRSLLALVSAATLLGCMSSPQVIRQTALERASFDLSCPQKDLSATQLGNTTAVGRSQYNYGAERTVIGVNGCGQKAVYVVECGQKDVCNAQLNADVKKDQAAAAP